MNTPDQHDLTQALARAVQTARKDRNLSVAALAEAAGVSRAMVAKIERSEAQPTAALLAKLSAALGLTLSQLIAQAESSPSRLHRHEDQTVWTDPDTGYSRRSVSSSVSTATQLVEVSLPPGARVAYPSEAYRFIDQQLWILHGTLHFTEGAETYELHAGDCLQLGEPADCVFENKGDMTCRYLVAIDLIARSARRPLSLS